MNQLLKLVIDYLKLDNIQLEQVFNPIDVISNNIDSNIDIVYKRIIKAKDNNERVLVFGDYDADGVMATVIIKDLLDKLDITNGYYIPNRYNEGYGLNCDIVKMAYDKGYSLIITVDNGVSAFDALDLANNCNIDVIVSDHHLIGGDIECFALVHPSLMLDNFHNMCGAGVALQISRRFIKDDYHVVLSMIATIGDMMPLWNENRNIVRCGLRLLNEYRYPNIVSLLSNGSDSIIDEKMISFDIVPKINSISRLDNIDGISKVNKLVEYFLNSDLSYINRFSKYINDNNNVRKKLTNDLFVDIINSYDFNSDINLIYNIDYPIGICGLLANRVCSYNNKPSLVFGYLNGIYYGSGRSKDFDLYKTISEYQYLFNSFGGHSLAFGLSIKEEFFKEFIDIINGLNIIYDHIDIDESLYIDIDILDIDSIKSLEIFKPLGVGIRLPLFKIKLDKDINYILVKDLYPKWVLKREPLIEAICFDKDIINNDIEYLIGELSINSFMGNNSISLLVKCVG